MNELIYEIAQRCKSMTIKNFNSFARLGQEDLYRQIKRNRFNNKDMALRLVYWLDKKIKKLIKFKLRAEGLLDEYEDDKGNS